MAIEAIKLVEGGLAATCDQVWVVTCDPAVQRERLLARGTPPEDADQRMAAQAGLVDRLRPAATWVLDASGPQPRPGRSWSPPWRRRSGRLAEDGPEPGAARPADRRERRDQLVSFRTYDPR